MPFKNYHSARVTEPSDSKYSTYRYAKDEFGKGVSVNYGILKKEGPEGGKTEVQAIRFDIKKFDKDKVKKWLKDHKQSYKKIEWAEDTNEDLISDVLGNDIQSVISEDETDKEKFTNEIDKLKAGIPEKEKKIEDLKSEIPYHIEMIKMMVARMEGSTDKDWTGEVKYHNEDLSGLFAQIKEYEQDIKSAETDIEDIERFDLNT